LPVSGSPIGAKDVRAFRDSLQQRRKESCRVGIYISSAGFTKDAERVVREDFGKDQIIILFSGREVKIGLQQRLELSNLLYRKIKEAVIRRP
jgi:hypothetical protein